MNQHGEGVASTVREKAPCTTEGCIGLAHFGRADRGEDDRRARSRSSPALNLTGTRQRKPPHVLQSAPSIDACCSWSSRVTAHPRTELLRCHSNHRMATPGQFRCKGGVKSVSYRDEPVLEVIGVDRTQICPDHSCPPATRNAPGFRNTTMRRSETTDNSRRVAQRVTWDLPVEHSAQCCRPSNPKAGGSNPPRGADQGDVRVGRSSTALEERISPHFGTGRGRRRPGSRDLAMPSSCVVQTRWRPR